MNLAIFIRSAGLINQVDLAELEREYRAQIERVFAARLHPTHLDSHCGTHIRRESIFAMTLGLAAGVRHGASCLRPPVY